MNSKARTAWTSGVIRPSKTSPKHLQVEFNMTAPPFGLLHPVADFGCYIDLPVLDFAEIRKGKVCCAGFVEFATHYVVLYSANVEECREIVSGISPLSPSKPVLYPFFSRLEVVALSVSNRHLNWWGALYRFANVCSLRRFVADP